MKPRVAGCIPRDIANAARKVSGRREEAQHALSLRASLRRHQASVARARRRNRGGAAFISTGEVMSRLVLTVAIAFLFSALGGCGKSAPWLQKASIVSTRWEAKGKATAVVHVTVRNDSSYAGRVNVVCDFLATPQWEKFRTRWVQETVYVEPGEQREVDLWLAKLPTAFGRWKFRVGLVRTTISGKAASSRTSSVMSKAEIGCYTRKEIIVITDWQTGIKPTYVPPGLR